MMPDAGAEHWFSTWLAYHQGLFPHHPWPESDTYYERWFEVVIHEHPTYEVACAVSKRMQSREELQRSIFLHLPALGPLLRAAVESSAPTRPSANDAAKQAREQSLDCPECSGHGTAIRHIRHPELGPLPARLYCRCSLGRFLLDRDQDRPGGAWSEDLQAWPQLWIPTLSHPTWSNVPTARLTAPGDSSMRWVRPGKKAGRRDTATSVAPTAGRNQDSLQAGNSTMNGGSRQC